jgi:hypothetical protein
MKCSTCGECAEPNGQCQTCEYNDERYDYYDSDDYGPIYDERQIVMDDLIRGYQEGDISREDLTTGLRDLEVDNLEIVEILEDNKPNETPTSDSV